MGDSGGKLTFGPSLSECKPFSDGILKAYREYKITMVTLEFVTEASSTSSGSIAYELDPHCEFDSIQSKINKFPITKGGKRTFRAAQINGKEWHKVSEDQFRILWKGNGAKSTTAGSFRLTITVVTQNPK